MVVSGPEAVSADRRWMRLALSLARRAAPAPNPCVGAVVVAERRLVAFGWHKRAGDHHAEVNALRAAGPRARGATLYVTLEPCNHHGRTPPCVDAILAAGIARVVIGCRDPNPGVEGHGLERLQRSSVELSLGVLGTLAQQLVDEWLVCHLAGGRNRRDECHARGPGVEASTVP